MPLSWDTRVVPSELLEFLRKLQEASPCRLSGGAALSGVHLSHRLSHDLDVFCTSHEDVRSTLRSAVYVAGKQGGELRIVRDGGTFVRGQLRIADHNLELDIVHDPSTPLAAPDTVDGIIVDSIEDMLANKITCLLSRAEPRDLVDLYFLDLSNFAPEDALPA